jgi:hypothetical protein
MSMGTKCRIATYRKSAARSLNGTLQDDKNYN